DMEGYGRSDKRRDINADIANGADDLAAASDYIRRTRGVESFLMYGISSGALRAALFAQRHPERVRRLALDAFVWTGKGSPTLADRRKRLPEYREKNRRPIDRAFVRSIFTRDHPGTADDETIAAFADAILALDDSVPTGTYVDMCAHLPLVDPTKITALTLVMRCEYGAIASFEDLVEFFTRLPNPDKQFAVMPGIAHASLQQKNYRIPLHILHSFFSQPDTLSSAPQAPSRSRQTRSTWPPPRRKARSPGTRRHRSTPPRRSPTCSRRRPGSRWSCSAPAAARRCAASCRR